MICIARIQLRRITRNLELLLAAGPTRSILHNRARVRNFFTTQMVPAVVKQVFAALSHKRRAIKP